MTAVVVLRPEPGASATAAAARKAGLDPVVVPLFAIVPQAWDAPAAASFDAVMMTSANAARHGGSGLAHYHDLPLYAVGAATAAAAEAAGFRRVVAAGPDAAALAARLAADRHHAVLDLGGRDRTAYDPGPLRITRRVLYAADPCPVDPAPLAARGRAGAIMLLHASRAAARLATLIDPAPVRIAALSAKVAAAAGPGWRAVAIAQTPDDAALLAAAARLCDHTPA